jgi:hypothetical protein
MSRMIDRGTLDRLIALGQAQGELPAEALRAALPVEQMEVDDLVLVMLELEAAGVSVEPDAFGPPAERPMSTGPALPSPIPGSIPALRRTDGAGRAEASVTGPAALVRSAPSGSAQDDRADVNRAVALAGLATLVILGAVLLML